MNTKTLMITGVAVVVLPLSACSTISTALSPMSKTSNPASTVIEIPGAPTPHIDGVHNATQRWVAGPDGTGLFAIGNNPRDGLTAIPAGRYKIEVGDKAGSGNWMVCESALCGPKYENYATEVGHAYAPYSSTIAFGPKSRTLWIDNLILTPAGSISAQ